jgi:acyl-CoA synthetase
LTGPIVDEDTRRAYETAGYWGTETLSNVIRGRATACGGDVAISTEHASATWADYDRRADEVARALLEAGIEPGQRVGVWLPDGLDVHAAMVATERIGAVAVGIGPKAGAREVEYLLTSTRARALLTRPQSGTPLPPGIASIELGIEAGDIRVAGRRAARQTGLTDQPGDELALGPNDLFLINSTSGTTGLPKRVTQFQNRWFYFHQLVNKAIDLDERDVMMSLISAPFGFGLWTAHFTPALAGVPVVLLERFSVDRALELIARERVTIMCCVSTQFIMMLSSPKLGTTDLSSLRAIFTGGEAVPFHRASEFEAATGASVLQFYGSNETGVYSYTSIKDSREDRLRSCGHVVEEMIPRLYDGPHDITSTGGPGRPACRGPATCAGYHDDPEGNAHLYTPDGWMLMEDIATIDDRGYVRLAGRSGDFIIRGGKNISAVASEDAVGTHPSVALVAVVPVPDDIYGERVGAFVVLKEGCQLTLDELSAHLITSGFSRDLVPERLLITDDLPRGAGGKIAKGVLRREAVSLR